jgi:hypothetical protein
MKKPFKTWADRQAALQAHRSPRRWDVAALWTGVALQALLLVLAGFGYAYTVVPVYQKELLAEAIAKKEDELDEAQNALVTARAHVGTLQDEIKELTVRRQTLERDVASALQVALWTEEQLKGATSKLKLADYEIERAKSLLAFHRASLKNCVYSSARSENSIEKCMVKMADLPDVAGLSAAEKDSLRAWIKLHSDHATSLVRALSSTPYREGAVTMAKNGIDQLLWTGRIDKDIHARARSCFEMDSVVGEFEKTRLEAIWRDAVQEATDQVFAFAISRADATGIKRIRSPLPPTSIVIEPAGPTEVVQQH